MFYKLCFQEENTENSFKNLSEKLKEAKGVLNNKNATEEEILKAEVELQKAIDCLIVKDKNSNEDKNNNEDKDDNKNNDNNNNDNKNNDNKNNDNKDGNKGNTTNSNDNSNNTTNLPKTGGTSTVVLGGIASLIVAIGIILRKRR